MPIEVGAELLGGGRDRFHEIDYEVMRHAFDMHNDFGCFCDELIFQVELTRRCSKAGLKSLREVPIKVTHGSFQKTYFADMLVEQGIVYELKTVSSLMARHESQLINYLHLLSLQHGKLINFGSESVESRYVTTQLRPEDRYFYEIIEDDCDPISPIVGILKNNLTELLRDWGVFLDIGLYTEALAFLQHEAQLVPSPVDILSVGEVIGRQNILLLAEAEALRISAIKTNRSRYETHLRRLLNHTPLQAIHWINFNNQKVTLKTITH